jgi:hypothetical protein
LGINHLNVNIIVNGAKTIRYAGEAEGSSPVTKRMAALDFPRWRRGLFTVKSRPLNEQTLLYHYRD